MICLMVDKILTNVLSNAFKFTLEGGIVEVKVKSEAPSFNPLVDGEIKGGFIEITIRDTGIGIPENQQDELFDRFYQVD